jgi:hypothetical protein
VVGHVLSERVADPEAQPEPVARKRMRWSWAIAPADRAPLTTPGFIRRELPRRQIGEALEGVPRGKRILRLPPAEAMLSERT